LGRFKGLENGGNKRIIVWQVKIFKFKCKAQNPAPPLSVTFRRRKVNLKREICIFVLLVRHDPSGAAQKAK
jgi:hypothetical protein